MTKLWEERYAEWSVAAKDGDSIAIYKLLDYHENQAWICEQHADDETERWHEDKIKQLLDLLPEEERDSYYQPVRYREIKGL